MPTTIPDGIVGYFVSQGVLGVIVVVLLWYIKRLLDELRDVRAAHRIEIAEERKLNTELQDDRLAESKIFLEASMSMKTSLDAFLSAIRTKHP